MFASMMGKQIVFCKRITGTNKNLCIKIVIYIVFVQLNSKIYLRTKLVLACLLICLLVLLGVDLLGNVDNAFNLYYPKKYYNHVISKELEISLMELSECEDRVQAEWKDRDVAARTLDKELEEQQNKLVRADKLLQKVKRDVRQLKESRIPISFAEVSHILRLSSSN